MLNSVVLMGRLTASPELKTTSSGISVARFRVAVERSYKTGGEKVADFIDCVAWRQTADFICKWFGKGQMIALRGSLQTRSYEDKNGAKRTVTEVNVDEASFCGDKSGGGAQRAEAEEQQDGPVYDDDDLPF